MKKIWLAFYILFFAFLLTACNNEQQFKVSFETNGGEPISALTFTKEDTPTIPTPIKEGHGFLGWYLNDTFSEDFDVTELYDQTEITLYAKWEINQYTITYITNCDDELADLTKDYNETLPATNTLSKIGYLFSGWYEDANFTKPFTATTMPAKNLTLYAKWELKSITIGFDSQGGSTVPSITKKAFEPVQAPTSPTKLGYLFKGWYTSTSYENIYEFQTMPPENITLYAKWQIGQYKISFVSEGEMSVSEIIAVYNTPLSAPSDPIRQGFTFKGWYSDLQFKNLYVFDKMPSNNVILYAKWEGLPFTITFLSMGGSDIAPLNAQYQSTIVKPTDPTKEGYNFVSWYKDSLYTNPFVFDKMPYNGATLYAKWEPKRYSITFDSVGGSYVEPIEGNYLAPIQEPIEPTKDGFVFGGWFLETTYETMYQFDVMPLNGVHLYANWVTSENAMTIDYVLNRTAKQLIQVRGSIFAFDSNKGFYIFDQSGQLFVSSLYSNLFLNDIVIVRGYLEYFNGRPFITDVTSIEKDGRSTEVVQPIVSTIQNVSSLSNSKNYYHPYVILTGVVGKVGNTYYLYDENQVIYQIPFLSNNSYTDLDLLLGKRVIIHSMLNQCSQGWGIYSYDLKSVMELLFTERPTLVSRWIMTTFNEQHYEEGSSFTIPETDPFGFATVTFTAAGINQNLYHPVLQQFLATEQDCIVNFDIQFLIDLTSTSLSIITHLDTTRYTTIMDYLHGTSGEYYTIRGYVIMVDINNSMAVLKDASGSIYLYGSRVHVGDEIAVSAVRNVGEDFIDVNNGYSRVVKYLFTNHLVNVIPNFMTVDQYVTMIDQGDYHDSEYVQLRAFVGEIPAEYDWYWTYYLYTDDNSRIKVEGNNYLLKPYIGMEIIFRGYVRDGYQGEYYIYLAGNRNDIQVPVYNDQERVNVLSKMFMYQYVGQAFHPFETFNPLPYHPILGGEITYVLSDSSKQYFDQTTNQFIFVNQTVPIVIDITFKSGSSFSTWRYSTTLEPFDYLEVNELELLEPYSKVYVKGLVVYWHPQYIIMSVDGDLVLVDSQEVNTYKGDYIVLAGIVHHDDNGVYVSYDDSVADEQGIITISRNHPVTLNFEEMTISEILDLDVLDGSHYTRFIQTTGMLVKNGDMYYLDFNNYSILIDPIDDYIKYHLDSNVGKNVTLRGFIARVYDGNFKLLFVGNPGDCGPKVYTDLEQVQIVKKELLNEYDETSYVGGSYFILPNPIGSLGVVITYEVEQVNLYNLSTGLLTEVNTATPLTIHVTLTKGTVVESFNITIQVKSVNSTNLTTIADWKLHPNETRTLQATVIALSSTGFLLQDATGYLFMDYSSDDYFYDNSIVGTTIEVTGKLTSNLGRLELQTPNTWNRLTEKKTVTKFFETYTIDQIQNLSYHQDANIGRAVQVEGILGIENNHYFVSNGLLRIYVNGDFSAMWNLLNNKVGCKVKVKGFLYGLSNQETSNEWEMMITNYSYDGGASLELLQFTLADARAKTITLIQDSISKVPYAIYDVVYLPSQWGDLPFYISYQILSGGEAVDFIANAIRIKVISTRTTVKVRAIYTSNQQSGYYDFEIQVEATPIGSFEDLFKMTPEMATINVYAILLKQNQNWAYFLIDGNVYYLDNMNMSMVNVQPYQSLLLVGKRSVMDGVANYSYEVVGYGYNAPLGDSLSPRSISIADIVQVDLSVNDIRRDLLSVFGKLGFDSYLNMYYLENLGYRIYVRYDVSKTGPEPMLMRQTSPYDQLEKYLNEYVYMNVYYPNLLIRGEYPLVDFKGEEWDIMIPATTPQEHLNHAVSDYHNYYQIPSYRSGDFFDMYDYNRYHDVEFIYHLKNSNDAQYLDLDNRVFLIVDQPVTVPLLVTATYLGGVEQSVSFEITITIEPMEKSSIHEVVYGKVGKNYYIEGIIVAYANGTYIIVQDETGSIVCNIIDDYDDFGVSYSVGDKVKIIAERSYLYGDVTPNLYNTKSIQIISHDNPISYTPVEMNMEDYLEADYLNPAIYGTYVKITGDLIFTGNSYYPSFAIQQDGYSRPFVLELLAQDYDAFNNMMYNQLGDTLSVEGYLYDFFSYFHPFSWEITYVNHTVIVDQ